MMLVLVMSVVCVDRVCGMRLKQPRGVCQINLCCHMRLAKPTIHSETMEDTRLTILSMDKSIIQYGTHGRERGGGEMW